MDILIKTIPKKQQRYKTAGDWYFTKRGNLVIRVSRFGDWRKEFTVALHEVVEAVACKVRGVAAKQVDAFDMGWKPHHGITEPGEDPKSPYFREHAIALSMEYAVLVALGIKNNAYERSLRP